MIRSPLLAVLVAASSLTACTRATSVVSTPSPAQNPAAGWWQHVQVLADDPLNGRDTGSPAHESASGYIA